jgi:dihydrolipoamide dehydrogenase
MWQRFEPLSWGLKTAVVEKDNLGGVCLNWGCIPSKSLIHQAETFHGIHALEKMGVKADTSGFKYQGVQQKSRAVVDQMTKGVGFLFKKTRLLRSKARQSWMAQTL